MSDERDLHRPRGGATTAPEQIKETAMGELLRAPRHLCDPPDAGWGAVWRCSCGRRWVCVVNYREAWSGEHWRRALWPAWLSRRSRLLGTDTPEAWPVSNPKLPAHNRDDPALVTVQEPDWQEDGVLGWLVGGGYDVERDGTGAGAPTFRIGDDRMDEDRVRRLRAALTAALAPGDTVQAREIAQGGQR
ncbi:MAG: hypothetical protein JWO98_2064 [Frankiales bacterium]|nr:hypothetical protein [Frankiales bacterium]